MIDRPIFPQPIQPIKQPTHKGDFTKPHLGPGFQEILQKEIKQNVPLKFSKHAEQRLQMRNINMDNKTLERLNQAVIKAEAKGAKESLVLMDDLAFVVSIKNKTVITAVDGESRKENIFTNIDSAIII